MSPSLLSKLTITWSTQTGCYQVCFYFHSSLQQKYCILTELLQFANMHLQGSVSRIGQHSMTKTILEVICVFFPTRACPFEENHESYINLIHLTDGKVVGKLQQIIEVKDMLEAVARASSDDTSQLESFHSDINRNSPKMHYFSYNGMSAR